MDQQQRSPHPTQRTDEFRWKRWAFGIAALALVVLVAQNAQKVEVNFFFAETQTPLVFALLIAGGLGVLIGWLAPKLRRHDQRGHE